MNTYDEKTRKTVRDRICALMDNGLPGTDVADLLAAEGIKTPSGQKPNAQFVYNQFRAAQLKKRAVTRKPKVIKQSSPAKPQSEAPAVVLTVLADRHLSDGKKLALINAYYQ